MVVMEINSNDNSVLDMAELVLEVVGADVTQVGLPAVLATTVQLLLARLLESEDHGLPGRHHDARGRLLVDVPVVQLHGHAAEAGFVGLVRDVD